MTPVELAQWAWRHGIPAHAMDDLSAILGAASMPGATESTGSEARVQSQVRLVAASLDMRLFRNNVGVLKNEAGTPVRYGLCNDTPALNKQFKSHDLIGWRRVTITPEMVGTIIAQFTSLETKHEGWVYRGNEHEQAQARWGALVVADGGYSRFVSNVGDL